jgi:hypothetical protein
LAHCRLLDETQRASIPRFGRDGTPMTKIRLLLGCNTTLQILEPPAYVLKKYFCENFSRARTRLLAMCRMTALNDKIE